MEETVRSEKTVKLNKLRQIFRDSGSGVVAYSGGVDSTFLLKVGYDTIGDKCLAVTATSETYPKAELEAALKVVKLIGAPFRLITTKELTNEKFASNPPERCYFCKSELFSKLLAIAGEEKLSCVFDGANADDLNDYRPGIQAGRKLGVRSPLQEAGLTKEEIRLLAKEMGLPNWDKPSAACLSSRFPYGSRITSAKLRQVDEAETFMRELGFKQCRVRHHETIARLEVPKAEFGKVTGPLLDSIVGKLKQLGFTYVTIDLEGFRSGSMNEALTGGGK